MPDCKRCHQPIPPPEQAAYGGIWCENCIVANMPGSDRGCRSIRSPDGRDVVPPKRPSRAPTHARKARRTGPATDEPITE